MHLCTRVTPGVFEIADHLVYQFKKVFSFSLSHEISIHIKLPLNLSAAFIENPMAG